MRPSGALRASHAPLPHGSGPHLPLSFHSPAGSPLEFVKPEALRFKVLEPIALLGKERFSQLDIRLRVKGGGHVSQAYALRQAIAKAIVAYYQKCAPPRPPPGAAPPTHLELTYVCQDATRATVLNIKLLPSLRPVSALF